MRILSLILAATLTVPALAQGWSVTVNERHGAAAKVPPGFAEAGPGAANGDGRIFRSPRGAELTVFGDTVPGGDFPGYVAQRIAHEESRNGWRITSKTVAPDWAEYTGALGGRRLSVRTQLTCGGRRAISTRFVSAGGMATTISQVEASLHAAPGRGC